MANRALSISNFRSELAMTTIRTATFDLAAFLANAGPGRKIIHLNAREIFFSQGDQANSVFYLQEGRAKVTVVSSSGKEATIGLLQRRGLHWRGSAGGAACTAVGDCRCASRLVQYSRSMREEMIRVMHEEHDFSDRFLEFLLARPCESKPISSINFSTPVKSAWHEFSC